ncbi:MAG: hypothetical protein CSA54_04385 [Gammaproteobacteria bacterium]|nr:MAG: hypothetical protein CSA54_04385 [Gammaproteobacteria bacterium]
MANPAQPLEPASEKRDASDASAHVVTLHKADAANAANAAAPAAEAAASTQEVAPESLQDVASESSQEAANSDDTSNLVRRSVEEITALMARSHEPRENLIARGVPVHLLNSMITLGQQGNRSELEKMMQSALSAAENTQGGGLTHEELESTLEMLIEAERDTNHARQVARQQGLDMPVLQNLTQLIRQNPGDGGKAAINTLVAYALAANIELDRVDEILKRFPEESESVLPQIDRSAGDTALRNRRRLATNLIVGVILAIGGMWFVL